MKKFMQLVVLCLMMVAGALSVSAASVTALWDFKNVVPSSLATVAFEGSEGHMASNISGVQMFVIAKSGKFKQRTSDAQMNANTYLRIPVYNVGDQVTIVSCTGYHNYTVDGKTVTTDSYTYTATQAAVTAGWVQVQATATSYLTSVKLVAPNGTSTLVKKEFTAGWDFVNVKPSTLATVAFEGSEGHVASDYSGVQMFVIAKSGKFKQRTNDAQMNVNTYLRIPVYNVGDKVTIVSATGYHNYTVDGKAVTTDSYTYTATQAAVTAGWVQVQATATSYLKSIKLSSYTTSSASTSSNSNTSSNNNTSSSSSSSSSASSTSSNTGTVVSGTIGNYYIVKAGSASDLLNAISKANAKNTSTSSSRYCIFIPAGTYNLGTTCLTAITGHNISLIGEGMTKTIIKNAPSYANEGIGTTATILNKGQNNYLQDLTLQNAMDYYGALASGMAGGRAVCLQDKGKRTICKNVRLLSYQDTYYSNSASQFYWEGGDIHGTVDFICGDGDVFFNGTQITVEKRNADGTGGCTIVAPYTSESMKGYIFNGCKIVNYAANYNYARAWGGKPRCAFINTTLSDSKLISNRWTTSGMNTYADKFVEYNTKNTSGTVVSPSSLKLTFTHSTGSKTMETILTSSQAAAYTVANTYGDWKPNNLAAQVSLSSLTVSGTTLKWSASNASGYAIYNGSTLVAIVGSTTTSYTATASGTWSVRALNSMGGQGTAKSVTVGTSSSASTTSYDQNAPVGWATVGNGVTGSSNKNAITVTTADQLKSALAGTTAATIYIKGNISTTAQISVSGAENKTILGLPGSSLSNTTHTSDASKTGILCLKNSKNIIIRNVTFKGPGAYDIDGRDNLLLSNCQYVWVDHCDFQDACDGNFDCNSGSDYISVTWCRFRYLIAPWAGGSGGSNDHRFSNLWGSGDKTTTDAGKLRTTFANCWWDEGCRERMARIRFGQVHILNCLYSSSVANYCIGAGYKSNIYVEKSAFTSAKTQATPWRSCATSSGYTDYNITFKNCSGVADLQKRSGSNGYFTPSSAYSYTSYDATKVEGAVKAAAGSTLSISAPAGAKESLNRVEIIEDDELTTGIDMTETASEIVSEKYYTASGTEVPGLQQGINVVKTTLSDGTVLVKKVMVK